MGCQALGACHKNRDGNWSPMFNLCRQVPLSIALIGDPAPLHRGVRSSNHDRGCDRRDAWVGLSPDLKNITSEPTVGKGNTINESEMALFFECMQSCARKGLDTADIVRDAIYRLRRDASGMQLPSDAKLALEQRVNGVTISATRRGWTRRSTSTNAPDSSTNIEERFRGGTMKFLATVASLLVWLGASTAQPPTPIQHVVIIFQEDRTPDNLFHGLPNADIANTGVNSHGQKITLGPVALANNYAIEHTHGQFELMYDAGKMDGADKQTVICNANAKHCPPPNPQFKYVPRSQVAPYFQLAEQYTFAD